MEIQITSSHNAVRELGTSILDFVFDELDFARVFSEAGPTADGLADFSRAGSLTSLRYYKPFGNSTPCVYAGLRAPGG